jgi:hypothetical protein
MALVNLKVPPEKVFVAMRDQLLKGKVTLVADRTE